ncbi:MAG: hypothetical protein HFJ52_08755 [Clostridia bacterium]|nr:hypothetical protein [Clostridia bacterium]
MLKEKIINLYYIEHLSVKDIAHDVNTSSSYISKIIQKDSRYNSEKIYRKEKSKSKRKVAQNNFIKQKRERQRQEDNYDIVRAQHNQATREFSKHNHLSNENYRKWNYSAYKYSPSKHRYEFDPKLGRSSDVPKYIKER